MSLEFYTILTLLIVFTAAFSYINIRFIRLPATIGVMLISLVCSLVLVAAGLFYPTLTRYAVAAVQSVAFEELLMEVMLSFLLFAGAIHVDIGKLKKESVPFITLATIGVLLSTSILT